MKAGASLRSWLKANDKTQVWLAEQIGCSQPMVSAYINGGRPSYVKMRRIAEITGGAVALSDWPAEIGGPQADVQAPFGSGCSA